MTDKYTWFVRRMMNPTPPPLSRFDTQVANAAMGLAGEAGEVLDLIKKHLFHGHPLNADKIKEELGDVRFYLEALTDLLGMTMESVEEANVQKLEKRYAGGKFTAAESQNRGES